MCNPRLALTSLMVLSGIVGLVLSPEAYAEGGGPTPQILTDESLAQLKKTFAGMSDGAVFNVAVGDHLARMDVQAERVRDRVKYEKPHVRQAVDDAVLQVKLGALLAPAPNTAAILELGRRKVRDAISMLRAVAVGERTIVEPQTAVLKTVTFGQRGINSPADAAVVALAMAEGEAAIPALERAATRASTRSTARLMIERIGGEQARQVFQKFAAAEKGWDLLGSWGSLARMGDATAVHKLAVAFNDHSSRYDTEVAWSEFVGLGIGRLTKLLRDERADVRLAAIRALGSLDGTYGKRQDVDAFKPALLHSVVADPVEANRDKAIKIAGRLYGKEALVAAFEPHVDAKGREFVTAQAALAVSRDAGQARAARAQLARMAIKPVVFNVTRDVKPR